MIRGVGVDIIEIERIQKSIETGGDRFLQKIFTPGEMEYSSGKANAAQHFAVRFAAKEAVSKALSTGWSGAFSWKDVEVVNDAGGQPRIILHGNLRALLSSCVVHVSLSHSTTHVVAMVLIEDGNAK